MPQHTIAEVVVHAVFEDGQFATFTVSPSGQLTPSLADGVFTSAQHWYDASTAITKIKLRAPSPDTAAPHGDSETGKVGECFPWQEEDEDKTEAPDCTNLELARLQGTLEDLIAGAKLTFGVWRYLTEHGGVSEDSHIREANRLANELAQAKRTADELVAYLYSTKKRG